MNIVRNFIKKKWYRIGILLIGIFTLFGADRGCCACEKPKDITVIYVVDNDPVYYTYSNDTLFVRFWYHMEKSLQDSFNYAVIYFYGIRSGRDYPNPSLAFYIKSNDTIIIEKDNFPISTEGRWDTLFFNGYAPSDSYDIYVWLECWKQYPGRQSGAPIAQQKGA
ncbi:MAG: hypothetical protein ACUVTF_08970 [bacterium]